MPNYNSPIEYAHHFLAAAKGDYRAAEVEAWTRWEADGKDPHSPFSAAALLIADARLDPAHPLRALQ